MLDAIRRDIKPLTGIHGKTVDDDLCKLTVVDIRLPEGFPRTVAEVLAEIVVDDAATGTEQADRDDKNRRKDIQKSYVHIS